jgi:large subunit ribosomal protein L6
MHSTAMKNTINDTTLSEPIKTSRVGRLPITIPSGVTVSIKDNEVSVQGAKGKLVKAFNSAVLIELKDQQIFFSPRNNSRFAKAMQGTARSIVASMIKGVQQLFSKNLEINGTGYRAVLKGKVLELFLGKSHSDQYIVPEGIILTITDNTKIKVEGADLALLGQVAADIFHFKKVEPYKAKGVTIVGQYVYRKEGKKSS